MTVGQTSAGAGGHAGQRQVYRSDSGTLTADQLVAKFDRLALQVYVGARDGTLLFEAAQAAMRPTGLPGPVRLVIPEWAGPRSAFVEFQGNGYGSTTGIAPEDGSGPISALVAVADNAQDSVIETLHEVWPACPVHQLGAHPREHDGAAVQWCNGAGGHIIARIGRWGQMTRPLLARSYFGQDYELEAVTTLAAAVRDHWKLPFGAGAMELAAVMRVALGERDVDLSEITAAIQGEARTFSLMTASELRGWNETELNRLVAKAEAVAFKKSWAPHIAR